MRSELCALNVTFHLTNKDRNDAALLLLGVAENTLQSFTRQVPSLIMLRNKLFTSSLVALLSIDDSDHPVYTDGRDLMRTMLTSKTENDHVPLEILYFWALSCRSSVSKELKFPPLAIRFQIKCKALLPSRLFPGSSVGEYDVKGLKAGVMYYADKCDGTLSHPIADLFFVTDNNELVLVDVTGGDGEGVQRKAERLSKWMATEKASLNDKELYGVILAPMDEGLTSSYDKESRVVVVRRVDARMLLGGLEQCLDWLV